MEIDDSSQIIAFVVLENDHQLRNGYDKVQQRFFLLQTWFLWEIDFNSVTQEKVFV